MSEKPLAHDAGRRALAYGIAEISRAQSLSPRDAIEHLTTLYRVQSADLRDGLVMALIAEVVTAATIKRTGERV